MRCNLNQTKSDSLAQVREGKRCEYPKYIDPAEIRVVSSKINLALEEAIMRGSYEMETKHKADKNSLLPVIDIDVILGN